MTSYKRWFLPLVIGALLGAVLAPLVSFLGSSFAYPGGYFVSPRMVELAGSLPLAAAAQSLLGGVFGAVVGAAALPFADDGKTLLLRSVLHVLATVVSFTALLFLCRWAVWWPTLLMWNGILLTLYALIWLGRWVGWYIEVSAIREKLGLPQQPSPLKWRETMPYLLFLVLVCWAAPLAAWGLDRLAADVPVLSGLIYPYLLLPVVTFCAGLSLGKRQGLAPLFPLAAGLLYLPMVFLLFNPSALFHCFHAALPALAGNLVGSGVRARRRKRGNA